MLLNVHYRGGINVLIDTAVTRYITSLGGESLGAGCFLLGEGERDLQFRVPDECRDNGVEITSRINFLVGNRIIRVSMGDETGW